MAGGVNVLPSLQGKVNANNALRLIATTSAAGAASTNGPKGQFLTLKGKVDSSNRLFVKIV